MWGKKGYGNVNTSILERFKFPYQSPTAITKLSVEGYQDIAEMFGILNVVAF